MASQASAQVFITNQTDGTALIQLYHQNSTNGVQSGAWIAGPGQKVGPMTVNFETGISVSGVLDYWWVRLSIQNGSTPGVYTNTGSATSIWKECQLQSKDSGKTLAFTVSTSTFKVGLESGACSDGMKKIGPYTKINNVFVLMLENHSFDNMLAMSGIPGIVAATTADCNSYNNTAFPVLQGAPSGMPTDPGHEFSNVVTQLCGPGVTYAPGSEYPAIHNSGFAYDYAVGSGDEKTGLPNATQIGSIMACFDTAAQLPVLYQLATEFAVCDRWFSSLPGPTWPNRYFVHGASSNGLSDSPTSTQIATWETVSGFTYPHGSIYDAMNAAKQPWRLYNVHSGPVTGAFPQVTSIKGITLLNSNDFSHFAADLHSPYPYVYTFIEPNYGNVANNTYEGGSSQHPMDTVANGEALIQQTYQAIRNSPLWMSSLLIVIYDEHGGFYDSVAPGPAPAPDDGSSTSLNTTGFTFTQYGVRVPAVVISPLIPKGTVDHTIYDHSSVPATLERLLGMHPLTQRDAAANDVRHLLTLSSPRTDCPATLSAPAAAAAQPAAMQAPPANAVEPVPAKGNLQGFLHIAAKTDFELSAGTPADKAAIHARVQAIQTRGEAQAYLEEVMAKVRVLKTPKAPAP